MRHFGLAPYADLDDGSKGTSTWPTSACPHTCTRIRSAYCAPTSMFCVKNLWHSAGRLRSRTARECGRKLMVGQCLRFEPLYLFLKDAIDNNTFGKVRSAYFTRLSGPPHWGFEGWYRDTSRSGGAIMDLHIHDVDMVRFLFGEPEAVSAISYDTFVRWAVVNSRFIYGDERIIVADASWDEAKSTKFSMSYRVRFEQATVKLEGGKITVYPESGSPYTPELPGKDRMAEQLRTFATAILGGGNTVNPPESAMLTVRLVEKLRESADSGGAVVPV